MTERDAIDELIDQLNDGVDGITFDRDLIDTNRPGDWGAVELVGQDGSEWADGNLIDQVLTVDIWAAVNGSGSAVMKEVQDVLRSYGEDWEIGWRLAGKTYQYDVDRIVWRWTVIIYGRLTEAAESNETAGSGTETGTETQTGTETENSQGGDG